MTGDGTLGSILDRVEDRRKALYVHADEDDEAADVAAGLSARNATVRRRPLPPGESEGFVAVREDDRFRGAVPLSVLETFTSLSIRAAWDRDAPPADGSDYRPLFELLDDTLFASIERSQLLAASREIEDRAWRVGEGTLRAGFQREAAFEAQRSLYERMAAVTDLDVHVHYAGALEDADDLPFSVSEDPPDAVGRFWFLAFDGGGDDRQACALLAEERNGAYYGFWTYDPDLVGDVLAALGGD